MKTQNSNLLLPLVAIAVIITVFSMMLTGFGSNKKSVMTPKAPLDEQEIKFSQQKTSDETVDIEKDINGTDFSKLDQDLTDIEEDLLNY